MRSIRKMVNIHDIKYLKEIRFNKKHFSWTLYALLRFNLIALVTVLVFEAGEGFDLGNVLNGSVYLIGIATLVSITIVPLVDMYNFVIDRKICDSMEWDYDKDFMDSYSTKQIDKIRDNYKGLIEKEIAHSSLKVEMYTFINDSLLSTNK